MPENKDYLNVPEADGHIHISEEVAESIAISAAKEVDGVHNVAPASALPDFMKKVSSRGVRITRDDGQIAIDICLVVEYGVVIPEVAAKVQTAVIAAIESMTGCAVHHVNVHVVGVHLN